MKKKESQDPTTFGFRHQHGYNELFNLYGEDNLQLEIGDSCFFLLTGLQKYYLPVIMEGLVLLLKTGNGQERTYYITPTGSPDDLKALACGLVDQQFLIYDISVSRERIPQMSSNVPKPYKLNENNILSIIQNPTSNFFNSYNVQYKAFQVNSFYVRGFRSDDEDHKQHQLEEIKKFRREYLEFFKEDSYNAIREMDFLLSL